MKDRVRSVAVIGLVVGILSLVPQAFGAEKRSQSPANGTTAAQSLDGQSQTILPDGRHLLLGGIESGAATSSAAFQDMQTGAITPASSALLQPRAFHSATLLPNGKVVVLGGIGEANSTLNVGELFDPVAQTSVGCATDLTPRSHHTATLLTDGRVLVAGGLDSQGATLSKLEIWDYRTGQSTVLGVSLSVPRSGHTATLLSDGTVLLSGGQDNNGQSVTYGEIIDPNGPSVHFVSNPSAVSQNLGSPRLGASIPQNGEGGIPINQLISLRFSKPLSVTSLDTTSITLRTSRGQVAIQVVPAEAGMLAFITPQSPLQYGTAYTLSVSGATDNTGQRLPDSTIVFSTVVSSSDTVSIPTQSASDTPGPANSTGAGAVTSGSGGLHSVLKGLQQKRAAEGVTALAGQVLALDGSALENVVIKIRDQQTTTDNTGRFLIKDVGTGHHVMIVDGSSVSSSATSYGIYRIGVNLKAGQTNSLNHTVWMTPLDTENVVNIPSPTTKDMVISTPKIPGLELHIPAGTIIHDVYGKVVTQIGITQIPTNQPPFPLKKGVQFPVYFTVQPAGATFSSAFADEAANKAHKVKGATIYYQNHYQGKPGDRFEYWNYDPAQKGWYVYGHGRVSADSKMIVPEAGTQIFSFDGAMVSLPGNAPPNGPKTHNPSDGDPVDLQTGLFVYTKTDLAVQDVIPLTLTRTYRQGDNVSRAFGIGTSMSYDMFLVGDALDSPEGYTYQDLILADGGRVHFTRTSPCLGYNGYCDYNNAVYTAISAPGSFYGATLQWSGSYWTITAKNGTIYQFPDSNDAADYRQATLIGMQDRYGNALRLNGGITRGTLPNLTSITSPNGRSIQLTYDSSNRITQAIDNIGRTTSYTYNSAGYLATATDVMGGVTSYTYDAQGNMLTITDPRGIEYLQNQYDDNDMVSGQTEADGGTFQFAYSLDSNSNVTATSITDPRGYVRNVTFNSDGYMTSDTHAVGKPEQQTILYSPQQGTGLQLAVTDPLGHVTSYSYDPIGNVTSITRLAGTSNAVTTVFSYDPRFEELSSVTDPLGNTAYFNYNNSGNMLTASDPLGNTSTFAYNADGQVATATDSLGNQTQFSYDSGDLVSITDPLGRAVSRYVDAVGRVVAVTDPLNHTTRFTYDPANEITTFIDPQGNQTSSAYDANGNRLTLTDANQHTTTLTYDNMDRPITRKDALGNQSSAQYDLRGNLVQSTDRKGQVTIAQYDGLNRPYFVGFGAQGSSNPTYASTIAYTYDGGSRLIGVYDSKSGTISRGYDNLNRLVSETTPQGSVGYTYDPDGRRQSMTVSGQSPIGYSFDNRGRLTAISQASSNVSFGYDSNGRRTSLTLPNGVIASYTYDAASQLTGIAYQGGALSAANLSYTYDLAGHRVGVGGNLASTQLPAAINTVAYDANNQLTQWGSTSMTYDANGSTLNDGMNTYAWDERNHLAAANSNTATFAYDSFGRRVSKTILSDNTNFLYDGPNAVQELNGPTVTANLLTGGVDERYIRTDATGTSNYLTDAVGSTIALTDTAGNKRTQYSYEPYGNVNVSGPYTTNSFTYTGRESDGLGIYYYRARYYNPSTGRFLSQDPIGIGSGTMNLYGYAGNSPTSFRDPSGKCLPTAAAGAAVGAATYAFTHRKDFSWAGLGAWAAGGALLGCGIPAGLDLLAGDAAAEVAATAAEDAVVEDTPLSASETWGNPDTLADHFARHGADFNATSEEDYAHQASQFLQDSQADGLPTKIDADGTIRVYDPNTNTFGSYNPDGTTKTFFQPDPASHPYPTNLDYWNAQPGTAP
jgi:RHS repeat-associated protein